MTAIRMILVAVGIVVPWSSAGCSTSGDQAPGAAPAGSDPDAQNVIHASADATQSLRTAHVTIAMNGSFNRLGQVSMVDGDAQVHPLVANGHVTYEGGTVAPFVLDGGSVSVKLGDQWNDVGRAANLIPAQMIDPGKGLPEILDGVTEVRSAGTEVIDGVDTIKVTGTLPAGEAKALSAEATGPADFTAWIRKDKPPVLARALVGIGPEQSITVSLSNINDPVQLTPVPRS